MKLVGTFDFCDTDDIESYFSSDNKTFYLDRNCNNILSDEELNDWAVWLNSPWSFECDSYCITANYDEFFHQPTEGDPEFKCEYSVVGYDGVMASCYGYGDTPEEALADCKRLFEYLQAMYNSENQSV